MWTPPDAWQDGRRAVCTQIRFRSTCSSIRHDWQHSFCFISILTCMLIQYSIAREPSDAAPMVPGSDGRQWHHPPPPPPPPPVHGHGVLQQAPVTPHQPTWQITGPLGAPSDTLQGTAVRRVHQRQDVPPPNYTMAAQQGPPAAQQGIQIPWQPHQGIARGQVINPQDPAQYHHQFQVGVNQQGHPAGTGSAQRPSPPTHHAPRPPPPPAPDVRPPHRKVNCLTRLQQPTTP